MYIKLIGLIEPRAKLESSRESSTLDIKEQLRGFHFTHSPLQTRQDCF